jgi:hypothetical protein
VCCGELMTALYSLEVTIYRCSVNPITNPNPVSSHYHVTVWVFAGDQVLSKPKMFLVLMERRNVCWSSRKSSDSKLNLNCSLNFINIQSKI